MFLCAALFLSCSSAAYFLHMTPNCLNYYFLRWHFYCLPPPTFCLQSLFLSISISTLLVWRLLSKVTSGEQSVCCIQRERGSSTPACERNTLSWTICQATDYMIAAPLRHSGEFCFKSQKHDIASPPEQRRHSETKRHNKWTKLTICDILMWNWKCGHGLVMNTTLGLGVKSMICLC